MVALMILRDGAKPLNGLLAGCLCLQLYSLQDAQLTARDHMSMLSVEILSKTEELYEKQHLKQLANCNG